MIVLKYLILIVLNLSRTLFLKDLFLFTFELNKSFVFCTFADLERMNDLKLHQLIVKQYYEKRKDWHTSNLGTILFKNADPRLFKGLHKKDNFLVLVRPYESNELTRYWKLPKDGRLKNCTVTNCKFSHEDKDLPAADAVVFNVHEGYEYVPNRTDNQITGQTNNKQIWILFTEESPMHTFGGRPCRDPYPNVYDLAGRFNWMMSYRSDSEVPVPFGRTVPLREPVKVDMTNPIAGLERLVPFWKKKQFQVLATSIVSNCDVRKRINFLQELSELMDIHLDGTCFGEKGKRCYHNLSPDIRPDCTFNEEYIFYLAFENSSCRQYLTEKCFHNAYLKGAIPVIMGPPVKDCEKLLPPNSYLHVDNYKTAQDLAKHMAAISQNPDSLLAFHAWRIHFQVLNEHGYFKTESTHYCRVCEALNYNDGETKIYDKDDMSLFFGERLLCNVGYNKHIRRIWNHKKKRYVNVVDEKSYMLCAT